MQQAPNESRYLLKRKAVIYFVYFKALEIFEIYTEKQNLPTRIFANLNAFRIYYYAIK